MEDLPRKEGALSACGQHSFGCCRCSCWMLTSICCVPFTDTWARRVCCIAVAAAVVHFVLWTTTSPRRVGCRHSPNDKTSSRFRRAPEPSFQSKVVRGNYQTHLSDAIMFIQTTINPHGPNHCRNTSAFAKQVCWPPALG